MERKQMGRKCSHCRNIGHNSRTCTNTTSTSNNNNNGGMNFKLFGVPLHISNTSIPIKKTLSFESSSSSSISSSSSPILSPSPVNPHPSKARFSYLSNSGCPPGIKKGVPWSEEEHWMFLIGLEKFGKGDWRGISENFVKSRTPTQVASHAQKYFLQPTCISKSRRRSSLFSKVGGRDNHGLHNISINSKDSFDLYQNSPPIQDHHRDRAYSDKTLILPYNQPSYLEKKMDSQPEQELQLSSPLAAKRIGQHESSTPLMGPSSIVSVT